MEGDDVIRKINSILQVSADDVPDSKTISDQGSREGGNVGPDLLNDGSGPSDALVPAHEKDYTSDLQDNATGSSAGNSRIIRDVLLDPDTTDTWSMKFVSSNRRPLVTPLDRHIRPPH